MADRKFKEVHMDEWLVAIDRALDETTVEPHWHGWVMLYWKYAPAELVEAALKHLPHRFILLPAGPRSRACPVFPREVVRHMCEVSLTLPLLKYVGNATAKLNWSAARQLFPADWAAAPKQGDRVWVPPPPGAKDRTPRPGTLLGLGRDGVLVRTDAGLGGGRKSPRDVFATEEAAVAYVKEQNEIWKERRERIGGVDPE